MMNPLGLLKFKGQKLKGALRAGIIQQVFPKPPPFFIPKSGKQMLVTTRQKVSYLLGSKGSLSLYRLYYFA